MTAYPQVLFGFIAYRSSICLVLVQLFIMSDVTITRSIYQVYALWPVPPGTARLPELQPQECLINYEGCQVYS